MIRRVPANTLEATARAGHLFGDTGFGNTILNYAIGVRFGVPGIRVPGIRTPLLSWAIEFSWAQRSLARNQNYSPVRSVVCRSRSGSELSRNRQHVDG